MKKIYNEKNHETFQRINIYFLLSVSYAGRWTLEGQLADQKLSRFLVTSDLTKSNGTRPISVGLLNSAGSGGRFPGSLGSQLFAGSFSTGRFASSLLGTRHFRC